MKAKRLKKNRNSKKFTISRSTCTESYNLENTKNYARKKVFFAESQTGTLSQLFSF